MKKLLVFIIAFSSLGLTAQTMAFSAVEVRMKDHTEKDVLEAFDKVMEGVKPNKGGVVLERIWYNSPAKGMTHRMVWLYTLGEDLFDDESIDEDKNEAFWAKMGNYVEDWGTSYSGRMLSWKEAHQVSFVTTSGHERLVLMALCFVIPSVFFFILHPYRGQNYNLPVIGALLIE